MRGWDMDCKLRESEAVEFKKSTSKLKEAVISVGAILNKHQGGELYFGIGDDGVVVGQEVSEKTLRTVSQKIAEKIEPAIYPEVKKVMIQGKSCVNVRFQGSDIPYYAHGRVYMRVGDEDRRMSGAEIRKIILKTYNREGQWDNQLSAFGTELVNELAVREFMKKALGAGRIDFGFVDVWTTLHKLDFLQDERLLKAAEVLFTEKNPMELQMAIFAGTDKRTFLDIKIQRGNLFTLLKEAELYIKQHIKWRVQFGKLEREEIPEIPVGAIREALVNSLCHRDYRIPKGNEVAIFKDRVEIYNPGSFPEGLTPEDFLSGKERSILRNPLIAEILFRSKDIEKWGSGLKRIHDECRERGVKVKFELLKTGFLTSFPRPEWAREETEEKIKEETKEKTSKKILQHMKQNPSITTAGLAAGLGLSVGSVEWSLRKLKEGGKIRRVGPKKGGHWEVPGETLEERRVTRERQLEDTKKDTKKTPEKTPYSISPNTRE